jgi:hypothetical protein
MALVNSGVPTAQIPNTPRSPNVQSGGDQELGRKDAGAPSTQDVKQLANLALNQGQEGMTISLFMYSSRRRTDQHILYHYLNLDNEV